MPKLNRWTMRARVGRMERERPDLEHSIVKGLYEDYFKAQEREPSFDEFREHVDEVTSTVEWRDLHEYYSPHEPTEEEKAALMDGMGRGVSAAPVVRPRRPGRPGWTAEVFWAHYRDACARSGPPCTYRTVALHFDSLDGVRGVDPDHLRKLLRRFGPPPT